MNFFFERKALQKKKSKSKNKAVTALAMKSGVLKGNSVNCAHQCLFLSWRAKASKAFCGSRGGLNEM